MKAAQALGLFAALACLAACATQAKHPAPAAVRHAFAIEGSELVLDGAPFVLRAGELDMARVPHELWRDRLRMVRALGCNAVSTALSWSDHEPRAGELHFDGQTDAAEFCRTAQAEGLWVLVRIGPYVGAEHALGGLPWWLLQDDVRLRSRDPRFLAAVERWFARVGAELAPLQVARGGPILMAEIESEYGSFGDDAQYLAALRDMARKAGLEVPLYTCDAPETLAKGTCEGVVASVAFGDAPDAAFAALKKVRPSGPSLCGAYYTGWFDSWGKPHHSVGAEKMLADLGGMLERRESFVLHVAHGGTSFASTAGAGAPPYSPKTTSHDYDAPIDEAGRATPKFHALRALLEQHVASGEALPPIPASPAVVAPELRMTEACALLGDLPPPARGPAGEKSLSPASFEALGQAGGCVLYRATLPAGGPATLRLGEVHDVAQVRVDGLAIDVIDRRAGRTSVKLGERANAAKLEVLVETIGRVDYGSQLFDRKGLLGKVELADAKRVEPLVGWEHVLLPFDADHLARARYAPVARPLGTPALYRGSFTLDRTGDAFLDLRGWSRGTVWVNGHELGRYWAIGPQQTLYVPSPWLKKGANTVVALDVDGGTTTIALRGLEAPILDRVDDAVEARRLRKPGQELLLDGAGAPSPAIQETFADQAGEQKVVFPAVKGRYVALVAKSSQRGDPTAACAELYLLGKGGVELPRSNWSVIWADSEELQGENGAAVHVIDGDPTTAWQTVRPKGNGDADVPAHPHTIVLDLGEEVSIAGLRYLPRANDAVGRIGGWALYVSKERFPGV